MDRFIGSPEGNSRSLLVVNRTEPRIVRTMLEDLFERQPVRIGERELPDGDDDVVCLVDDGEVVATSSLASLEESILLVNSDRYITGTGSPEASNVPDVLVGLEGVPFRLHGYPASHKEKLLLIAISRHIEAIALRSDGGRHRASFQRLSRIEDERGTRAVYERLAESPVDTHVYGVPDWTPPSAFDVTMHGGWSEEFRRTWFVTFAPESNDATHAALVAYQVDSGLWEGCWTFDSEDVTEIQRYVEREM